MTRSRRRARTRAWGLLLIVGVLLIAVGGHGTGAYTTGNVGRTGNVNVTADTHGVYGIDTAAAIHINTTERLVTLSNRLDRDVSATVSLRSGSTDKGDLVVDGTNEGDEVTLSLAQGTSQRIDIAVPDNSSLVGQSVNFDVRATAPGLHVAANNRSVPIES